MAAPAGTNSTYGRVGLAEDIHDVIYDISPTDTPASALIDHAGPSQLVSSKNGANHSWTMKNCRR